MAGIKKNADSCNCQRIEERWVSCVRNYKNYIRKDKGSKVFAAVALIVIAILISMIVLEVCGMFEEPLWKPDTEFPIVNTHVSWMQTWYEGAF